MSIRWTFLFLVGLPLAAACGDDTGTGGQDTGGNGTGGENTGAGGINNDGGAGATGGESTGGAPNGGGGASEGGGGASEGGGGASEGGGGAQPMMLNGCTLEDAEDRTEEDEVQLAWTLTHQRCIRVAAGTTVTWFASPSFASHPLRGGETPTVDANSPIPATSTGDEVSVDFDTAGEFPYFCNVHFGSMQGVVYVE